MRINENYKNSKAKRWILNSISILFIFFLVFFIFLLYQNYEYYSVYDVEELKTFFSLRKVLSHEIMQAFEFAFVNMIIYQPIFFILDKFQKKYIYHIALAIIFILVINFILFINLFSL